MKSSKVEGVLRIYTSMQRETVSVYMTTLTGRRMKHHEEYNDDYSDSEGYYSDDYYSDCDNDDGPQK